MEKITEILQQYGIFPQAIVQVTDRVFKIKAAGKQYALKRSKLDKNSLEVWQKVYEMAAGSNLHEVIPVYLTQQRKLYVEYDGDNYYLTPWIEGNKRNVDENRVHSIYRQLGRIHVQTKKIFNLDQSEWKKGFQIYKKSCERYEKRLFAWIEELEQIRYPSPFELQVLTHFRDIRLCLHRSQFLVDQILHLSESEINWGVSLIHGNLTSDHIFEHFLINWEQAVFNHAIIDLTNLLHHEAAEEPHLRKYFIEEFSVYLEEHPLNRLEQSVLCLYLLDPSDYLKYVEDYHRGRVSHQSQINLSMELEKIYRKISLGLAFDHHIANLSEKND